MSQVGPGASLGASYRVVEQIGAGAAGEVWRVESTVDGASYAAKILRAEHANDPMIVERFIRERSVLIELRHPSIVAVRDLVVEGSTIAIVMDYVPGGSLRDLLNQQTVLPPAEALLMVAQVFEGLAEAHTRQVTHRDIKPDNVLLQSGYWPGQWVQVQVADFGVASVVSERPRQTTGLLGTPQYMAPELISHGQTTPAADVYSTGVMFYELVAGRTPFAGPGNDFAVAYRHVTTKVPRLELPAPVSDWLDRLLAKDPRERPSAGEAAVQAQRLANDYWGTPALVPSLVEPTFEGLDRPATVLRGDLFAAEDESAAYVSPLLEATPELGESGQTTMLRPMPKPAPMPLPEPEAEEETKPGFFGRFGRKTLLFAGIGAVLLVGLGVGAVWLFRDSPDPGQATSEESLEVAQQDQPLPTGLGVSRKASYDPSSETITVEYTYTAQKAPLSGDFLEVLPATVEGGECPSVAWQGADARKHQASSGVAAKCGWTLRGIEVPENGQVTFAGTFPGTFSDQAAFNSWLNDAAGTTGAALFDTDATSTAYPVQRIQGLSVVVPSRMVSQQTIPITVNPIWPGGEDELNPLYRSPATGTPTSMFVDIAGDESDVRFSDSCSGAVAISTDGLTATTLSPTSQCRIHASIGNFTDLESSPFSITTRE